MQKEIQISRQKELLALSTRDINNLLHIASNGGKLLSNRQPLTLSKVLSSETMSVGFLRKQSENCEKQIISLYVMALAEASRLFPNNLDSASITDTAFMILNEYPELKPEEIILVLKNGIAGKYGKMYHSISCAAVMEWAAQYQTERVLFFETKAHNSSFKNDKTDTIANSEDTKIKKSFIELKNKVTNDHVLEIRIQEKEKQNAWNKILQGLSTDFDQLHKKQHPGDMKAIRFVKYNNEQMDYEKYVNTRLQELNQKP